MNAAPRFAAPNTPRYSARFPSWEICTRAPSIAIILSGDDRSRHQVEERVGPTAAPTAATSSASGKSAAISTNST
jgi:hypothetical protein